MGDDIRATVVMVPRERFSATQRSLESLYADTGSPFDLVYVDGGSPGPVRRYLAREAERRGFRLIRTNHYLSPNQARNLGLRLVETPYVVFVDNDVIVTPGWLETLIRCAEETGATVVGPLCLIGELDEQRIHMASGDARIEERNGQRALVERHNHSGKHVDEVRARLRREPSEVIEFHTLLARTSIFSRLGPLDEGLLNTREHVDFCLRVRAAGEHIYFEPSSVMTYLPPRHLTWSDLRYMMLRWSDSWSRATLEHFCRQWNLPMTTFEEHVGWLVSHRRMAVDPWMESVRRVAGWRLGGQIEHRLLRPLELRVNKFLFRVPQPASRR
jgi:GT2 family glycosyltransferase